MSENLKVLYNFIERVKNSVSPGLYIGKVSLLNFQLYLQGFTRAQWEMTGTHPKEFYDFITYIGEYFNEGSNRGWASIILKNTTSEEEAFDTFYRLFEEFINLNYKFSELDKSNPIVN